MRAVLPDLCFNCHNREIFFKRNIHPPLATGACLDCHKHHASDYEKLLVTADICYTCHAKAKYTGKKVEHSPVSAGMCPDCHGLGTHFAMDLSLVVPDETLSVNEGAIAPIGIPRNRWKAHYYEGVLHHFGFHASTPWRLVRIMPPLGA